jgi:tetratricopeptide (TPR) repeat protein
MADFYQILGISRSASSTEIRIAYKRLAMEHHPDHNQGNKEAEELFKKINEAYHTLSDPLKKSRYDAGISEVTYVEDYRHEARRKWYHQWQYAQQTTRYKIDKEYFKIQGLAFLVFIVIAGFCFTVIHTAVYFKEQKVLEEKRANAQSLQQVNSLFISGRFDDAFTLILSLREKDPLEYRFSYAHDSLVTVLRKMADEKYDQHEFADAITHYRILEHYEDPVHYETIQKISLCQYYLGNYKEALQAMKHLHNQNPNDLVLIFNIGIINLDRLENFEEARQYFTLGKKLFKQNLSAVYGEAFMLVMDPADAPDIYFDIFYAKARTNLLLNNFEEALQDCNWAVYLRPKRHEIYTMRAAINIRYQKFDTVCADLTTARKLGAKDVDKMIRQYCR